VAGVFRSFDTRTVAIAAAAPPEPGELARLGRELAELYVRATAFDPEEGSA
jgi:hypothetical protein